MNKIVDNVIWFIAVSLIFICLFNIIESVLEEHTFEITKCYDRFNNEINGVTCTIEHGSSEDKISNITVYSVIIMVLIFLLYNVEQFRYESREYKELERRMRGKY